MYERHGHTKGPAKIRNRGTRVYKAWCNMKTRCYNKNNKDYPYYGGRGIKVCSRWRNNFSAFLEDMGEPPKDYQLDRINNEGNYEPGNCRWTDKVTQMRNCRKARPITFNGRTQLITEWAYELGVKPATLIMRFHRGWSVERALTQPFQKPRTGG